nr:hypothetical protein [Allobaculum sp. Allo2]
MKAAIAQIEVTDDLETNLSKALVQIEQAAALGADLILLVNSGIRPLFTKTSGPTPTTAKSFFLPFPERPEKTASGFLRAPFRFFMKTKTEAAAKNRSTTRVWSLTIRAKSSPKPTSCIFWKCIPEKTTTENRKFYSRRCARSLCEPVGKYRYCDLF